MLKNLLKRMEEKMPNPRFLQTAERWMNQELPEDRSRNPARQKPTSTNVPAQFPTSVDNSSLLEYDDFGRELITKSNERFRGTKAGIPIKNGGFLKGKSKGEVPNMYVLKRLALISTIANDSQLRSGNVWPITPLQSELLFKEGKLPKPSSYWEDLGLLLYDISPNGYNPKEAQSLYDSLAQHRGEFGLSQSDLSSRLLVVNAGLEVDASMPHEARPIAIPGVTQIYHPQILEKTGSNYKFEYGLDNGVPKVDEIGKGNRTIYMPSEKEIGLRVLCRGRVSDLDARSRDLVYSYADGRVNFAPQARTPKK